MPRISLVKPKALAYFSELPLFHGTIDTPLGQLYILLSHTDVVGIFFKDTVPYTMLRYQQQAEPVAGSALFEQLQSEMASYFEGRLQEFTVPILQQGTALQERTWQHLAHVPYGTITTYGAVARAIGRTAAVRPIAQAHGANRLNIIVPCHRTNGATSLTGYRGGIARKQWLQAHEHHIRNRMSV